MKILKKVLPTLLTAAFFVSQINFIGPNIEATSNLTALSTVELNLSSTNTPSPEPKGALPTVAQYKYQKEELAAFCHFGPNTFSGVEWGERYGNTHPRDLFLLREKFDAEILVRTLKEAGFKRLIVTAKHHDGFAIWRSRYTDYDIESTNYEGDVLAEISAACTKYNMDMGLYLSPWDIHEPSYGYRDAQGHHLIGRNGQPLHGRTWEEVEELDVNDYNEFYDNQLKEILGNDEKYGNHGRFVEVWMDGAKAPGANVQNYDFARWYSTIQKEEGKEAAKHTTDALLFGAQDRTTVRWIGNEWGRAPETNWSPARLVRNREGVAVDINTNLYDHFSRGFEDGDVWTVPESDARITSGWFWGNNKKEPKSIVELGTMYFETVGRNSPLLLNVPPNDKGKIESSIIQRINQFAHNIRSTFRENLLEGSTVRASSVLGNDSNYSPNQLLDKDDDTYWTPTFNQNIGTVQFNLASEKTFDVFSVEETIKLGQRVNEFLVEYQDRDGRWQEFGRGTTIGAKRLLRKKPVTARAVRLTVKGGKGQPVISSVGIYRASDDFSLAERFPDGMEFIDNTDTDVADGNGFILGSGWHQETGAAYTNGTNMWASGAGKTLTVRFRGRRLLLRGTKDRNHGKMQIAIDGGQAISVNTKAQTRSSREILFATDDLGEGEHTLVLTVQSEAIGIEGAIVIPDNIGGYFEFEKPAYYMKEKDSLKLKIKRLYGSSGEASVLIQNNPGSAVQSDYDADRSGWVTFQDGETEKEFEVTTKRNSKITGDIYFDMDLVDAKGSGKVGFRKTVPVHISDVDEVTLADLRRKVEASKTYTNDTVASGLATLNLAITKAEEVLSKTEASAREIADAYLRLELATQRLVMREKYTEDSPYLFPTEVDTFTNFEAEFANELHNSGGEAEVWKLEIGKANWASNQHFLNSLNANDRVTYPYYAAKAGTYEVTAYFRSGNAENSLRYSEKDGKIRAGSEQAGNSDSAVTRNKVWNIEVLEAGKGVLVLEGGERGAPQLDYLKVTLKNIVASTDNWQSNKEDEVAEDIDVSEVIPSDNSDNTVVPDDGGSTGGSSDTPSEGGSTGGSSDTPSEGGSTGGSSDTPSEGGSTGGSFDTPSEGGSTGGSSDTPSEGGSTGGSSDNSSEGGSTGGSSDTPSEGGSTGGSSDTPSDGGSTGGSSDNSSEGGSTDGSSDTPSEGGSTGGSSDNSSEGGSIDGNSDTPATTLVELKKQTDSDTSGFVILVNTPTSKLDDVKQNLTINVIKKENNAANKDWLAKVEQIIKTNKIDEEINKDIQKEYYNIELIGQITDLSSPLKYKVMIPVDDKQNLIKIVHIKGDLTTKPDFETFTLNNTNPQFKITKEIDKNKKQWYTFTVDSFSPFVIYNEPTKPSVKPNPEPTPAPTPKNEIVNNNIESDWLKILSVGENNKIKNTNQTSKNKDIQPNTATVNKEIQTYLLAIVSILSALYIIKKAKKTNNN